MKLRVLLLLLLLAAVSYFGYEVLVGKRDPIAQLAGLFPAKPAAAPQTAPAAPVQPDANALVLSSPPRESAEEGAKRFGPMANFLSRVLGRPVVYRHPGTWGGYQTDLQRDAYDFAFDGPHFVSWRIEQRQHHALVKLPGDFLYVGFVQKKNAAITEIGQLAGQTVCVHAPPNLGTLMLLNAFDNPTRQPKIVITKGYDAIFKGLIDGQCEAAMLPTKHLQKHDKDGTLTRVIYSHPPYPQQALTAGLRISADDKIRIVQALTAPAAQNELADFREAYALSGWFVPATDQEYAGLGVYLKTVAGFYK